MDGTPGRTIVLDLLGERRSAGWSYPLASGDLWCDVRLLGGGAPAPRPAANEPAEDAERAWEVVYDGPGIVDGGEARIRSLRAGDGSRRVVYADGECFAVAPDGGSIGRILPRAAAPGPHTVERALGAPLVLALAVRGVHVLHASAVAGVRGVIALVGDTGAGKSTLAGAAAGHPQLGLHRVADDQLPVALDEAVALPRFPQLKLADPGAELLAAPAALPWRLVAELHREGPTAPATLAVEPLGRADGSVALARATVAARLFDAPLLARHLEQCAQAASRVRVVRLRYLSGRERLGEALAQLAAALSD